jgi:ABC-2 type transport system ATP-binding protein
MKLELKNIEKAFGEKKVLTGVSFVAEGGKAFGLLGRNGAGKTTSIRILMNVFGADRGEVLLDGKPINYEKIGIGYLPEERGIYTKNRVLEQLIYFGKLRGMSGAAAKRSACELLERFGITEYANMTADKLSKGNQQKVQLAATMIHDPELIILDEPFSGLDPVNAESLRRIINGLVDEKKYIIMSSHQMATVEDYCRDLVLLHRGHALVSGNLRQIKESYGVTRLAVTADADVMPFAEAAGLKLRQKHADHVEFAVPERSASLRFLTLLSENSIVPTRFEMLAPSLNEIFIDKVGEELQAGGVK